MANFWDEYTNVPANIIRPATRRILASALKSNPGMVTEGDPSADWEGFMEEMYESRETIESIAATSEPHVAAFEFYVDKKLISIGQLLSMMTTIGLGARVDSLRGCIQREITALKARNPIQDPAVDSNDLGVTVFDDVLPVDEKRWPILDDPSIFFQENYDAFVSYNDNDKEDYAFTKSIVDELERLGFKLFFEARGQILGDSKYTKWTQLIKKHCRKVLIVLSPTYSTCPDCDFILKFVHSASPGLKARLFVPILRTPETSLPDIIRFVVALDAVKEMERGSFYPKLVAYLGGAEGDKSGVEGADPGGAGGGSWGAGGKRARQNRSRGDGASTSSDKEIAGAPGALRPSAPSAPKEPTAPFVSFSSSFQMESLKEEG